MKIYFFYVKIKQYNILMAICMILVIINVTINYI